MWLVRALNTTGMRLHSGGSSDLVHPRQLDTQHIAVQEHQGIEGLPVRGRGHLSLIGEHGQESLHIAAAHITRVPHAALLGRPQDEEACPAHIGFFSREAIVQVTDALANLIQQTLAYQGWRCGDFVGFVIFVYASSMQT